MDIKIKDLITDKISGEWGEEVINDIGTNIIRTTNFTNLGTINFSNIVQRKIDQRKIEQKQLTQGDVIIEKSGGSPTQPVGRVVYFDLETDEIYLCNNFTAILRPNKLKIYPKYFFYQLFIGHIRGKTLKYQNKTTGIINLKLDNYINEKIYVPSKQNQIRIAEVLTKVQTLIQQRKESIDLLDDFLRSTFLDIFIYNPEIKKWDFTEVKNTVEKSKNAIKAGPFGSSLKKEFYVENGYKIYGQEQVIKDDLNYGNYYINEELYKKLESCKIKEGDVLISLVGTYGKIIVVPKEFQQGIINPRLMKISFDKKVINPIYFKFFFKSEFLLRQLSKLSRGGTMDIINVGIVKEIKISIPPIKLQNKFAATVEKAEKVKEQYKISLKELENLFGSLSQKAFKGELDLSKLNVSAQIREIEKKVEAENGLDISLETKLTKSMQQFIKQTADIQKRVDLANNMIPKSLFKQIEIINKTVEPFQNLNKIPEQLALAMKSFDGIKSLASQLNQETKEEFKTRLTWEEVNFSQVAQWINNTYKEYNFNIEMLFNFLVDEHVTFPNYYSSEELKSNPKLVESDDLKSFIFSALNNENQFIRLEQFFYDAVKENVPLKLREEDFNQIKDKEKELRSGIFFKVVE